MSDIDLSKYDELNNEYVRNSFYEQESIEVNYDSNYLVLGRDKYNGKLVGIDAKDATRVLLIAIMGAGKTWLLRSFMDRAIKANQFCIIPNDCKDEFKSSIKPLQSKFKRFLLPNEEPRGSKVVTLRPTFFKTLLPSSLTDDEREKQGIERYDNNYWFSPDIQKMGEVDFSTLFNVHTMSPVQKGIMYDFFKVLKQKSEGGTFTFQMLFEILHTMDISEGSRQSLSIRMKPILDSFLYEKKWERSVVELMENGFIPAINFEGFDRYRDSALAYPEAVMFMVLREVIEYMRDKKKRKFTRMWILIDEGARFFPNIEGNKLANWLEESYELDRAYGVSYFFATQDYTTVPPRVKGNSRYVLLSGRASVDLYKEVMRDFGCFTHLNQLTAEAKRLKQRVSTKNHEWILFDKDGETARDMIKIFKPLAPLSHHMETEK